MIQTRKIFRLVARQPEPEPEPIDEFDAYKGLYDWMKQFSPNQQHRILRTVAERLMEENGRFEE